MIFHVSLPSVECWWITTKSSESSWSSRTMWSGNYPRSSRKSMITTKTNSIRKPGMKWMNGPALLIDMVQSWRNLSWCALFVAKIWMNIIWILIVRRISNRILKIELLQVKIPLIWDLSWVIWACITLKKNLQLISLGEEDITLGNQVLKVLQVRMLIGLTTEINLKPMCPRMRLFCEILKL